MKLYHGSYVDIKEIDFSMSFPNKDFGKGFYLSDNYEQAFQIAKFKSEALNVQPVVNVYEFDEEILTHQELLSVKVFKEYSEDWADFVLRNRTSVNGESIHNFDIVYGPIANDRVGLQIRKLIEHDITFDRFIENLKYMKGITFQYFFGTKKSLDYLRKI
ncbi:MAG: DUF3990 domain-containing protein [Prevotellaceae bacterium]|nr:DUF3990 domain-containing protein [Prevotellaceae bacterium]